MPNKDQLDKMEVRKGFSNLWHMDLTGTMSADPAYCCFSIWCGPCSSYLLRRRAIYGDMTRYKCCAGYMPCSGKCGEQKCPEFCLAFETCCCFSSSVASTRFLLQDEFNIRTTKCDNCIIGFMFCLAQVACICSLLACILGDEDLAELAQCLNCLSDTVQLTVCACMQTQHKIEMDKRDGLIDSLPAMAVPPMQQMSRMDQPGAPAYGYPAQQAMYGYPPAGQGQAYSPYPQPPPQGQGYPPPGYPPSSVPHPSDQTK